MTDRADHREAEETNRVRWDEKALVHIQAYKEVQLLRDRHEILDEIELHEVGAVQSKRMLHLQCHIGTDTLAWARHGAIVTLLPDGVAPDSERARRAITRRALVRPSVLP